MSVFWDKIWQQNWDLVQYYVGITMDYTKGYKRNFVLQFVYLRDNLLSVLDGIEILTRVKVSFLCIFLYS